MDNSNFWDWDNEDEHRVSSVYRDADGETVQAQDNVPQNNVEQNVHSQGNAVSNNIEQDANEENVVSQTSAAQIAEAQNNIIQNPDNEQTNVAPSKAVAENNFILVDNPQNATQNSTPQTEISSAQPDYQQSDYQQIGNRQANNQQPDYQPTENQQADYQQTAYRQPNYQQNDFQQMIPVQNIQQNQGTNRQKAKQNKYTDYSSTFDRKDISENKVSAMAAYLLGPVGIIIALLVARDSAYTAFHVRQALKLTICSVVLEIIAAILALFAMIPLVGIIFKLILIIICAMWLGVLILRLVAIAQVCDGEAHEPAIIGKMNCFR